MTNKKNTYLTILCLLLIVLGLVSSLWLSDALGARVINVITAITAVIGAVALFYQFKKDKNLNEASFLVEYSQQFYAVYDCADLMNELEKCRVDPSYPIDMDRYYQKVVGYLEWLETLAALVNSGLLSVAKIDNVMSYRFFLIVNNKQIQERELIVSREFYRGIYELYPVWSQYKKQKGLPIIFAENELSHTIGFDDIVKAKKKS